MRYGVHISAWSLAKYCKSFRVRFASFKIWNLLHQGLKSANKSAPSRSKICEKICAIEVKNLRKNLLYREEKNSSRNLQKTQKIFKFRSNMVFGSFLVRLWYEPKSKHIVTFRGSRYTYGYEERVWPRGQSTLPRTGDPTAPMAKTSRFSGLKTKETAGKNSPLCLDPKIFAFK